MSEPDDERPREKPAGPGDKAEREARLAAALRANLKRRKAGAGKLDAAKPR